MPWAAPVSSHHCKLLPHNNLFRDSFRKEFVQLSPAFRFRTLRLTAKHCFGPAAVLWLFVTSLLRCLFPSSYPTTLFATNTRFIGRAPAGGNAMFQKFDSAHINSNAPCSFPSRDMRTDTMRHAAFFLLYSFDSWNFCPTGSGASSRITPPLALTETVLVRKVNFCFSSSNPVATTSMVTTARAVLRRSILRQCRIAISSFLRLLGRLVVFVCFYRSRGLQAWTPAGGPAHVPLPVRTALPTTSSTLA